MPYFGLEYTTLPDPAKVVPPRIILSETLVPFENGLPVIT